VSTNFETLEPSPELSKNGLSDRKLAQVLSINPTTVWKWRNGKSKPKDAGFWEKWRWDEERSLWFEKEKS
jgi:transcriptional regulator with XRE-family HTH domain